MYYVGMLQDQSMLLFRSDSRPTAHKYRFFRKVMGPYESESEARYEMKLLRGRRNPCGSCGERHRMSNPCGNVRKRRKKNPEQVVSHRQALALTKKVIVYAKKLFKHEQEGIRKKNPGEQYHNRRFIFYMRELEKYKLGSSQYMSALARAYENLEAANESVKEGIY